MISGISDQGMNYSWTKLWTYPGPDHEPISYEHLNPAFSVSYILHYTAD